LTTVRIIGPGRAGRSLAAALKAAGCDVTELLGRSDDCSAAASGVDVLILTPPDDQVAIVARSVSPVATTAVLHCSGSLSLEVLEGHARRGSLHPLVTLPDPVIGGARLRSGAYFAVAGDGAATDLALLLGGEPIVVPEAARAQYHAAACIAANHVVALLGQVERVAADAGLPLAAFVPLVRGALDDVSMLGPAGALTGPAARGDVVTIERHRIALDPAEVPAYDAGVELARRLRRKEAPASLPAGAGPWS
jgi:predicted short-subunit dehydrogenase-like oxidoreductase (DUF2520 family)